MPLLKQRIAGKSLPVEKFAVKKSARYFEQNHRLTLPAYVCNQFLLTAACIVLCLHRFAVECLLFLSVNLKPCFSTLAYGGQNFVNTAS